MSTISIGWATRPAMYKIPSEYVAKKYNLSVGEEYKVYVHGIFQVKDVDGAEVYFICEFEDGRCCYADPQYIRFIDGGPEACE